ncbi:hypothetical protein A3H10_04545 [Candidatus Uhrbacteria bacterium RIFCSPLOWO2_12_FULL_46_10]|uniref:NTP pyrophosphohydrolase MazG-like domain-containing protein n=1 Tax=Candidatus Uhrbacteria bacterium RIFCSPLOWO2_01_FULL_47_25 TaxID=1802402 RepID=A0A1F7UXN4_9BACT|nr:MAG: hypothetical protein UX68_C0006G0014 [Parcubacteria group bacterium GW2011_GWA2_46_9]OGL59366.1 MAG: hypothetical protein A2752_05410 [Candidatus Uhrbacteria bacterium RIFCSPHIGHO2_01_FULL_46_23]OGL69001.1 MAG: hypothetical protein A3D60_04465 [Candidatus Uhrbacteria bacterium RIFCSPHIGHO2_02_FULL_47_29]OGL75936.1 MAG: hypothetical protein A3E96_03720 [Candidatus Uhrbacteria bacterium RIFCSPHIGHO2_12_FULL_46_13]OGL82488.1 MAG: hypothetical protein A2936_02415 [Candidatus Uhrbacteria bac
MTFEEYQKLAKRTALYPNAGNNFVYPTLGLAGEAGEVANKIKKIERDSGGVVNDNTREALLDELGDVLWYVSQLSTELNLSLEIVAEKNLEKLAVRLERGKISGAGDQR